MENHITVTWQNAINIKNFVISLQYIYKNEWKEHKKPKEAPFVRTK